MKIIYDKIRKALLNYFIMTRTALSSAVALSAAVGFVSYSRRIDTALIPLFLGIFLFASAASALNQYQEKKTDAVMERTKGRPLASRKIKLTIAFVIITLNFLAGFIVILLFFNIKAVLAVCLNLICYNLIYTPLKRKTRFAVLTGAITGAIPPVTGWIAAGGNFSAPEVISIGFFLFMWQVPHFLLLFLKYSSDYRKANFPELFDISAKKSYKVILFTWIVAAVISSMTLILTGTIQKNFLSVTLTTGNIIFLSYCFIILFLKKKKTVNKLIHSFYLYQGFVLLLLVFSVL